MLNSVTWDIAAQVPTRVKVGWGVNLLSPLKREEVLMAQLTPLHASKDSLEIEEDLEGEIWYFMKV